jgi:predicted PurR-regulated permease PerM
MTWPRFPREENPVPKLILIAFLIGVLYLFYFVIRPFLNDIFISILITLVFYPVFKTFLRIFRGHRIPAGLATMLLVMLGFLIPIALLSGVITQQSFDLVQSLTQGLQQGTLKKTLEGQIDVLNRGLKRLSFHGYSIELWKHVGELLKSLSDFIYQQMTGLAKGFLGLLLDSIIILFISFFLIIDGEKFLQEIKIISPLEDAHYDRIMQQLERTIKATLKGSIIVAFVQGLLGGIGFWIFGIPSAAFWGVCMVFSSVVPLVGTSIIWIPAVLYLALTSSFWMAIGMALWGTLIISGADNILRPTLLKGAANLHPLMTFLSVLGGIMYFGFLGFILGPVVLSFLMTLFEIYKQDYLSVKAESFNKT